MWYWWHEKMKDFHFSPLLLRISSASDTTTEIPNLTAFSILCTSWHEFGLHSIDPHSTTLGNTHRMLSHSAHANTPKISDLDLPWNLSMWSWSPHSLSFCLTNSSAIFQCCKGNEPLLTEHRKQNFHHAGSWPVTWPLCVCACAGRETQSTKLLAWLPGWLA